MKATKIIKSQPISHNVRPWVKVSTCTLLQLLLGLYRNQRFGCFSSKIEIDSINTYSKYNRGPSQGKNGILVLQCVLWTLHSFHCGIFGQNMLVDVSW